MIAFLNQQGNYGPIYIALQFDPEEKLDLAL